MQDTNAGKLAPTWEGPYKVTAIAGAGAYYLEDLNKIQLSRPWNAHNLKNFIIDCQYTRVRIECNEICTYY